MTTHNVKLPIKVGIQEKYDKLPNPNPNFIYVCSDTGNIYLGTTPLGGSGVGNENSNVIFHYNADIPESMGALGQYCITPSGVYWKSTETEKWELFSRYSITESGELAIDGKVPVADLEHLGFVRSSTEDGKVFVNPDGTMSVNGWDDIEVSLNFVYRSDS